jgi:hypothetical protein
MAGVDGVLDEVPRAQAPVELDVGEEVVVDAVALARTRWSRCRRG